MRKLVSTLFLIVGISATAQFNWTWTTLAPIPMATANNAVCGATVNGAEYVYSFGGIDTSLVNDGIHQNAFMYDVTANVWSALPDIPDTLGKIASGASVVGEVAYVIGGYYVFNGAPFELSSDRVHRLDLNTNTWLPDGTPVPVPIDDHVQAVWNDSLIYVITGWSNTTNVPDVQIYDPAFDSWSVGTAVPNNNNYKVFGASGVITGDEIHYYGGGSTGFNFPAQDKYRRGTIDSNDPTQISWQPAITSDAGPIYRAGAFKVFDIPHWVGGSQTSYNYDAIAYNGSGVVSPAPRITSYAVGPGTWNEGLGAPHDVMDLRGVAELGNFSFIITGGIGTGQQVLSSTYLLNTIPFSVDELDQLGDLQIYTLPDQVVVITPEGIHQGTIQLFSSDGRLLRNAAVTGERTTLSTTNLPLGIYHLKLSDGTRVQTGGFWSGN